MFHKKRKIIGQQKKGVITLVSFNKKRNVVKEEDFDTVQEAREAKKKKEGKPYMYQITSKSRIKIFYENELV